MAVTINSNSAATEQQLLGGTPRSTTPSTSQQMRSEPFRRSARQLSRNKDHRAGEAAMAVNVLFTRRDMISNAPSAPMCAGRGPSGWWEVRTLFSSLGNILAQLRSGVDDSNNVRSRLHGRGTPSGQILLRTGDIGRLGIVAHGRAGAYGIDGITGNGVLSTHNLRRFAGNLTALGGYIAPGGYLVLMGCLSGQGEAGTRLVLAISRLMPHVNIVAFSTEAHVSFRPGALPNSVRCITPGTRDTDFHSVEAGHSAARIATLWGDEDGFNQTMEGFPHSSETSLHAKVARAGTITRWPSGEELTGPASLARAGRH
jgi:hypothetical protein